MTVNLSSVSKVFSNKTRTKNHFAIIGDSIDASTYGYSTRGGCTAGLVLIKNFAVNGWKTTDMLTALPTALDDYDFDIMIIKGGTNDLGAYSQVQTIQNLQNMVDLCKAKGVLPIIVLPPTRTDPIGYKALVLSLRTALHYHCQANDILCLDPFRVSIDVANGNWVSGYSLDQIHPTYQTHAIVGTQFATDLVSVLTTVSKVKKPTANQLEGGLVANPLMILDSNSDGWADGYNDGGASFTPTIATDSDFVGGKCQRIAFSALNNSNRANFLTSGFVVGSVKKITARIRLKIEAWDGKFALAISLLGNSSGILYPIIYDAGGLGLSDGVVCFTPNPADTYYNVRIDTIVITAGYTGSFRFGEFQVFPEYF
jgi:hypothetical protein